MSVASSLGSVLFELYQVKIIMPENTTSARIGMLALLLNLMVVGFSKSLGGAPPIRHGYLQVYVCKWWMGHYRSATAKRHICWSNTRKVGALDRGTLTKVQREEIRSSGVRTATTKVNGKGKKSYTGTQFLRGTGWGT